MLRGFAARTGSRSTLAALRAAGWGLLVAASGNLRNEEMDWIGDNGAWRQFVVGGHHPMSRYDDGPFRKMLKRMTAKGSKLNGKHCLGLVLPDLVGVERLDVPPLLRDQATRDHAMRSFDLSMRWLRRCADEAPRVFLAVQPGMDELAVQDVLGPAVSVFVGGDTMWKLRTMWRWGSLAKHCNATMHVARVNSQRRILHAYAAGAKSFDGSSVTRFPCTLERLELALERARRNAADLEGVAALEALRGCPSQIRPR